jgi:hypothetical protein
VSLFKPLRDAADGTSASCRFGLRRPGRVVVGSDVVGEEEDDGAGGGRTGSESLADGFGFDFDAPSSWGGVGVACVAVDSSVWPSGGFQRGHFFASAESSGTSNTSLSLRSDTLIRERGRNKSRAHSHDVLPREPVSLLDFDHPLRVALHLRRGWRGRSDGVLEFGP